jgi:hypothetical protein
VLRRLTLLPFLALLFLALHGSAAEEPLRWWKGNLHTHTLWSDGDGFPEMIVEWYRDHDYQFLALSDHNVLSQGQKWLSVSNVIQRAKGDPWRSAGQRPTDPFAGYVARFGTNWVETRRSGTQDELQVRIKPLDEVRPLVEQAGRFLLIQAEELTQQSGDGKQIHMGVINLLEQIATRKGATVQEVMRQHLEAVDEQASRTGRQLFVHVNHPNYKWGVTAEDLAAVVQERFFEVWNGVDGDNDPGDVRHPSTDEIWDIANTLRIAGLQAPPLYGVATDDSHHYHGNKAHSPPGRAWIMVRARRLTPETLIAALRAGDFYASTGVTLKDLRFDAATRKLSLRIQGRAGETFVTRFIGTRRGVSLTGRPRRDPDGQVVATTLDYTAPGGPQIGEVLSEARGTSPSYTLAGDELYVRAVVTSSRKPLVPSTEHEFQRAWTQPVGW